MHERTYPSRSPHNHGIPISILAAIAAPAASVKQGANASRATTKLSFFSAVASKPNPAFNRIVVSAISLQKYTGYAFSEFILMVMY